MASALGPFVDHMNLVLKKLAELTGRIDKMPTIRWATVTQASPLRVQLDGDLEPLSVTPQAAVVGLVAGDRVVCVEQHRRVIVCQVSGGGMATQGQASAGTDARLSISPSTLRNVTYRPYSEAMGRGVATPASGVATVTFPSGRFSVAPVITVTSTSGAIPVVVSVSATSFTCRQANSTGSQVAGVIDWRAAQMTSSTAGG